MRERIMFGVFEFDRPSGALWRNGRFVRLQRQPARMLAALIARPGEIVDQATLQAAVWGAETTVDFDRGLNFCAAQIRATLGDSAAFPRYIETRPKRGYRSLCRCRLRRLRRPRWATGPGLRTPLLGLPTACRGLRMPRRRFRATGYGLRAPDRGRQHLP
jgi:hypothetical protein